MRKPYQKGDFSNHALLSEIQQQLIMNKYVPSKEDFLFVKGNTRMSYDLFFSNQDDCVRLMFDQLNADLMVVQLVAFSIFNIDQFALMLQSLEDAYPIQNVKFEPLEGQV